MRTDEFDAFKGDLKQLCATLGKTYTDALGQAYWRALRDVDLDEVQAHVERIILNATGETKFPKPAQLRSTPGRMASAAPTDPAFREGEERAIRNLEELRRTDPDEWRRRVSLAHLDRIIATQQPDSPIYAQALREWRQARGIPVGKFE